MGIGLSAFFLIPTAYAMLLQTRPSLQHPSYIDLFIPKEGFSSVLYSSYTLGLTSIGLLGVLQGITKKRKSTMCVGMAVADNTMCAFVSVYIKWISIYTCKIFNTIYSFGMSHG